MQRERERVVWSAEWGREYEGWAASFIKSNIWRCDRVYEFQDLMQEAYLTFVKVMNTYPRVIEARHFMALYKRAMINQMHDRSCYKQRREALVTDVSMDISDLYAGRIGEVTNAGYLAVFLGEIPDELKLALSLAASDKTEMQPRKRRKLAERENLSRRVGRILGMPSNRDPIADLKTILTT